MGSIKLSKKPHLRKTIQNMNCLFCKCVSDNSKSVEHIIPESLGNKEHVLPKGHVCDGCNNYFARKVEGKLLAQPYFKSLRHRNGIQTKKGKSIVEKGIIAHPEGGIVDTIIQDGNLIVYTDNLNIQNLILNGKINRLYTEYYGEEPEKNNLILSRFLAKVALEALLYKLINVEGWVNEVSNKTELEEIKKYARYGIGVKFWQYHQRKLYKESQFFLRPNEAQEEYQVLHEFDFFWTKEREFYFVIAIMGIEYAINLANPSVRTYIDWLKENDNKSILDMKSETRIYYFSQ